jgi:hypothetical protein
MDMDNEGATLMNVKGSKFLDKEKHTSRGSKLMNLFGCIDMCIFMCLLTLHKFFNLICMLVCCMLVVELE